MKNPVLAIALSVVLAVTAVRAASSDSSDIHYSRPDQIHVDDGSPDWWNSGELTGDWGGPRNTFYDEGVSINASYLSNFAGNPVGGKSAGFTYCDNIGFELALDLEKLIGWKGGNFTVSGLNRDGSSLSEKNIGNQFTVQQVFGGSAVMFYALHLEQKLWDEKISIKIGRFATGDEFASSQIYWLYMNNGIDGNPQALPVNTQFSAYPWAVWAARVRVDPTPEFNALAGVYQVSDRIFNRNYHGLDWSMRSNDSILLIGQIGWTPEFFKRSVPVESVATSDGKTNVGEKSAAGCQVSEGDHYAFRTEGSPGSLLVWRLLVSLGLPAVWQHGNSDKFVRVLLACRPNDLPRGARQRSRPDDLVRFRALPAAEHCETALRGKWRPFL